MKYNSYFCVVNYLSMAKMIMANIILKILNVGCVY